ncbi:MAG: hypothetical protein HN849_19215 [Victivallales bacterium]|jgi:hypothetical protein|nr:hypothetical protein [Victivallales bacterium]MBT7166514.1 hypothetical protein [Victivallales bacterium]MBT7301661.1 hypothetical protein [Victivallales bacterium]
MVMQRASREGHRKIGRIDKDIEPEHFRKRPAEDGNPPWMQQPAFLAALENSRQRVSFLVQPQQPDRMRGV